MRPYAAALLVVVALATATGCGGVAGPKVGPLGPVDRLCAMAGPRQLAPFGLDCAELTRHDDPPPSTVVEVTE